MQETLNLTDSQYETCVSILFVGYILMQIPSNLFLNKVGRPALYLPAVMVSLPTIPLDSHTNKRIRSSGASSALRPPPRKASAVSSQFDSA